MYCIYFSCWQCEEVEPDFRHLPHIMLPLQAVLYILFDLSVLLAQSLQAKCGHTRHVGTKITMLNLLE